MPERRAKVEALQWTFGQELLKRGLVVILEWGTWGRSERDALRLGARALGAAESGRQGHRRCCSTSSVASGRAKNRNGTNVVPSPGETCIVPPGRS